VDSSFGTPVILPTATAHVNTAAPPAHGALVFRARAEYRPELDGSVGLGKFLEILLMIVLPLAWGLLAALVFERIRRFRVRRKRRRTDTSP